MPWLSLWDVLGLAYIPLDQGLTRPPLGGYQAFDVPAWIPLGSTGVIRGAIRNATVTTNREMDVLTIPGEIYLRCWHHPITTAQLASLAARRDTRA